MAAEPSRPTGTKVSPKANGIAGHHPLPVIADTASWRSMEGNAT